LYLNINFLQYGCLWTTIYLPTTAFSPASFGCRMLTFSEESRMEAGNLGKEYLDGEIIIRQGELGNCMCLIQEGQVEVIRELDDNRVRLSVRKQGDFFGETAIFVREVRMETVRALGRSNIHLIDYKNLLDWIQANPSLAFRLVQSLSARIGELSGELTSLRMEMRENSI
jgi:CRP-like cAMP-binding protein